MYPLTPYPLTPIGNFIGVVLALVPLFSRIRKLSLAVWGYSIWVTIYCSQNFVNTIIWHNNINIVAPVWCDIAIKLQIGASTGTRTCVLVICLHLYKITRLRGSIETTRAQRRKTVIFELLMIVGIPVIIMLLYIIVQPVRFAIVEEAGCASTDYSYVGYIIYYTIPLLASLGCAVLAPLIVRTFLVHRKEMDECFSSADNNLDTAHSRYTRLMIIACVDTIINAPVLLTIMISEILQGKSNSLNYPYISWNNVHHGLGGQAPGLSLSTILQIPATGSSGWGSYSWSVFTVKWNEWLYVFHAIVFFIVFGTTPEMRSYYRSALWFIPWRCGFKRNNPFPETEPLSEVAFNSNPGQGTQRPSRGDSRRGSLSILETATDARETHSMRLWAQGTEIGSEGAARSLIGVAEGKEER